MLTSQANAAHKLGLTPNKISVIGFIFALASAVSYVLVIAESSWLLILAVADGCRAPESVARHAQVGTWAWHPGFHLVNGGATLKLLLERAHRP